MTSMLLRFLTVMVAGVLAMVPLDTGRAASLGTAFTYQGRITQGSAAVTGTCDFQFGLFADASGGGSLGSQSASSVSVTNGLFTAGLDFGVAAFTGEARYLEIAVRCPAGSGSYATLSPRQPLTPAPYAIYGASTGALRSVPISATAPTSGQVLQYDGSQWVPTTTANGGAGWALAGNAGTNPTTQFVGTTDNQALALRTNNQIGWRLAPGTCASPPCTPNVIGGFSGNTVGNGQVQGATIAGGGGENTEVNAARASFATVGGGTFNTASGAYATVAGGNTNTASADLATVAGGSFNTATATGATVSGGDGNGAIANYATVSGGTANAATKIRSTVGGGELNSATADGATVGAGRSNTASHNNATVSGGSTNTASGPMAAIGGGQLNIASNSAATVAGGDSNQANGIASTVGGGTGNIATGIQSTIGGGNVNAGGGTYATIGGGNHNIASADYATVPGGDNNTASGPYSFAAGRRAKADDGGAFVWADSTDADFSSAGANTFNVRANLGIRLVVGTQTCTLTTAVANWQCAGASTRTLKTEHALAEPRAVLEALVRVPVEIWSYLADGNDIRHLGPMAEDFHAAFGLGDSDKVINSLDAQGVAFAAIQGLYQLVQEKQAAIDALQERLTAEQAHVADLEQELATLRDTRARQDAIEARLATLEQRQHENGR